MDSLRTSLASKTSWRTHFEVIGLESQVLGLGLKTSFSWKLLCPWLEDSTIFWIVKILFIAWKFFWKTFFSGDRLKKCLKNFFFFLENTCTYVLGPWPREGLSSKGLSLASDFFLCSWSCPRALCSRLHLWYYANGQKKGYNFLAIWWQIICNLPSSKH